MNAQAAAAALAALRARWTRRWGDAAVDLTVLSTEAATRRICGRVVTPGQREALHEAFAGTTWRVDVEVLAEAPGAPAGWWAPRARIVDLWRRPEGATLSTQVLEGEGTLRALARRGNWLLVEADDGALGWARSEQLGRRPSSNGRARRLGAGMQADTDAAGPRKVLDEARRFEGTPYRLGGRSPRHVDCSGLVSLAARRALGVVLPRHSTDQRRCGRRIGLAALDTGDLLFAMWTNRRVPHVGLVVRQADGSLCVCHASLARGCVVVEPLDDFSQRVDIRGARRWLRVTPP